MNGQHVRKRRKGVWNGIWSCMMGETMYIKYGKGSSGLICITTNPRSVLVCSDNLDETFFFLFFSFYLF